MYFYYCGSIGALGLSLDILLCTDIFFKTLVPPFFAAGPTDIVVAFDWAGSTTGPHSRSGVCNRDNGIDWSCSGPPLSDAKCSSYCVNREKGCVGFDRESIEDKHTKCNYPKGCLDGNKPENGFAWKLTHEACEISIKNHVDDGWTCEEQKPVSDSLWFYGYQTALKAEIKILAQVFPNRPLKLVCVEGGPISMLEAATMSEMANDATTDLQQRNIGVPQIDIVKMTYRQFDAVINRATITSRLAANRRGQHGGRMRGADIRAKMMALDDDDDDDDHDHHPDGHEGTHE